MLQDLLRSGQDLFAFRGQADAAAVPHEHGHAEVTLQLLDLSAHGALGQAELVRSLGETVRGGDSHQGLQGLERGHAVKFIHAF
ncbi:hypothetical protein D3C81_2126270 [compost metagenome]